MDNKLSVNFIINSLPIYLQKKIIRLLTEYINFNNKQLVADCNCSKILEYRENESFINKLTLNLSLVSHQWFNTVSSFLNVSVDFNFNINSYYSIIKPTNVKFLKIHYNHQNNNFYKLIKSNEVKLTTNEINEKIKQLPYLDNLLIRNINISKVVSGVDDDISSGIDNEEDLEEEEDVEIEGEEMEVIQARSKTIDFYTNNTNTSIINNTNPVINNIENLNFLKDIEFKCNVELLEIEINKWNSMERLKELKSKISKVFSLNIVNTLSKELLFETFKAWLPSIRQLLMVAHESPMSVFPWYSLSSNGFFKNISYFDIYGIELRLSNISTIVKSSPNIKLLSFSICFDKLLYYTIKVREKLIDSQQLPFLQDKIMHDVLEIPKCTCNCLLFNKSNINYKKSLNLLSGIDIKDEKQSSSSNEEIEDDDREIIKFSNDWMVLCQLLKKSSIECLHMHQDCMDGLEIMQYNQMNHKTIIYPDCFIQELGGSLISPITSLKKISIMGLNSPQLFKYIVDNNKKIQNYIYTESILDLGNYNHQDHTSTFESIINENQQITELKYSKAIFSLENEINMVDYEDDEDELPYKDQIVLHYKL
ncbi:hypothetical protein RB653_002424 [Dictyostelium firmibasis]|uniref:F-box domain-containing protein n=1 Tax=Dictyostelium firmibasis TaxID=79012 RepID=A0AAN7TXE9_9MYCE